MVLFGNEKEQADYFVWQTGSVSGNASSFAYTWCKYFLCIRGVEITKSVIALKAKLEKVLNMQQRRFKDAEKSH